MLYVCMLQSRTSPLTFSISKASTAGFCLPLAQTHQKLGGKATYVFYRKASNFLETYFRKHATINIDTPLLHVWYQKEAGGILI